VAPASREHARERRKQRAIGGARQGAPFLPSEHPQLMSQYEQLESLANSLCRPPDQQPQHSREGEISDRKEHAPVLSPPTARTSEQQTLFVHWRQQNGVAQHGHGLVSACARANKNKDSRRYRRALLNEPAGIPQVDDLSLFDPPVHPTAGWFGRRSPSGIEIETENPRRPTINARAPTVKLGNAMETTGRSWAKNHVAEDNADKVEGRVATGFRRLDETG